MDNRIIKVSIFVLLLMIGNIVSAWSLNPLNWFKKETKNKNYQSELESQLKQVEQTYTGVLLLLIKHLPELEKYQEVQKVNNNIQGTEELEPLISIQRELIEHIQQSQPAIPTILKKQLKVDLLSSQRLLIDYRKKLISDIEGLERVTKKYIKHIDKKQQDEKLITYSSTLLSYLLTVHTFLVSSPEFMDECAKFAKDNPNDQQGLDLTKLVYMEPDTNVTASIS